MTTDETLARILDVLEAIERHLAKEYAPPPELLTFEAAAARVSTSPTTIRRMVARGDLRAVKVGERLRIPVAELERLARLPPPPPPRVLRRDRYNAKAEAEKIRALMRRPRGT